LRISAAHAISVLSGRRLAVIWAALLLAACASASYAPSSGGPRLAPYRGEVEVLKRLPPHGSFTRVGVVQVEGNDFTSQWMMMRQLKQVAAARGADAIVLQAPLGNPDFYTKEGAKIAAWAIRRNR